MSKSLILIAAAVAALLSPLAAQAGVIRYAAELTGAAEAPPNASPGLGAVQVVYDDQLHTLRIHATFAGLLGNTTAAHIHCCTSSSLSGTAAVATTTPSFVGFPLGVTSGIFDSTLDLTLASSYRSAFVTDNGGTTAGAEKALAAGLAAGKAYFNVHTTAFPGGEIRGFLQVPEPASAALAALGLGLLGFGGRRKAA